MLARLLRLLPRRPDSNWRWAARTDRTFSTATGLSSSDSPISAHEFHAHFQACKPLARWPKKLAIAFSGGSDSTCLLFLLKELFSQSNEVISGDKGLTLPRDLVAITIDHGLQAASKQMTARCVELANTLGIKHVTLSIPWGCSPFPALPEEGEPMELVARKARYHLLASAMRAEGASIIAFGHHSDDQVETALLRIAKGGDTRGDEGDGVGVDTNGSIGAAGMRQCRRWGMGLGSTSGGLAWAGHHGLNQWIVRPLLSFSKERMVATCRTNKLDYVEDSTNLQPHIGPRNQIRHLLESMNGMFISQFTESNGHPLKRSMKILLSKAGTSSEVYRLACARDQSMIVALRNAVKVLSDQVITLEDKVSRELSRCIDPSPVSSLLLLVDASSSLTDNATRFGIVRRVLRYVSPFPWGSPHAVACGRTKNLQAAVNRIWNNSADSDRSDRAKFSIGGNVLWTPVVITSDGTMKKRNAAKPGEATAWLATRLPPICRFSPKRNVDVVEQEASMKPRSTELDITMSILKALQRMDQVEPIEILYDCRFLLRIKSQKLPAYLVAALQHGVDEGKRSMGDVPTYKVVVVPYSSYYLPEIVIRRVAAVPRAHSSCDRNSQDEQFLNDIKLARLLEDGSMDFPMYENNKTREQQQLTQGARGQPVVDVCDPQAVQIEWIRVLDADAPYERSYT